MPIYQLDESLWFPPSKEYEEHGIIAVGGDVSEQRLLLAYQHGIFPWYNDGEPVTWWCPDKRMVLKPKNVKISKSSRNLLNQGLFTVSYDQHFEEVIGKCQKISRKGQDGTWINDDLKSALLNLHELGYAHSVECKVNDELVGGLYGISLGRFFFGESMFSTQSNASKIAFISLCKKLESLNFELLDCQIYNDHLASLGATEIERDDFLILLSKTLRMEETLQGDWGKLSK